jgi:RNA polymerase sigma-70 factor (ECF subfamily)
MVAGKIALNRFDGNGSAAADAITLERHRVGRVTRVNVSQRELTEQAGRGDHDAFAALVASSIGHLTAVARLIVRDHELARDAVQEAYIRAWRDLPGLRDPDRFDAWLHRLTVNACLDAVRRRRRRPIEIDIHPLVLPSSADQLGQVANRDQLERGFTRLPPDQRAVLVLHYYVGLPVPSIADTLGIPLGTAQSRLGRALASLRAALGPDEPRAVPAQGGQIA